MHQELNLTFYKFRFVFAGMFTIAILTLSSAVITATGSNTILDAKAHPTLNIIDPNTDYNPNAITAGASALGQQLQVIGLSIGRGFYSACHSMTVATVATGKSIGHSSATIAGGIWHGVAYAGHIVGSSILFTLRLPGKAMGAVTHAHPVSTFIRPADNLQVPAVISSQTSAEMLAQYNEEQRQKIASLEAEQLTANQGLGGTIIAGDPNHGGYPTKWENARQDSLVDNWGMYNRECVSYAAWKVYQTYGTMPYWGGVGNANQWVANAKAAGIAVGSTPKVHSVAISMNGYYGHAMWVEAIKGTMIYVSQYNYDLHGHYSEMWVSANDLTYLYFK